MIPHWWLWPGLFALGATVGSFLVTAAIRSARGEQVIGGRSHCDSCAAPLGFRRTVPVVSYVQARGRCADCGARIPGLHLAGEVAGGALFVAVGLLTDPVRAALLLLLGVLLIAAAATDAVTQRLPNVLTAGAALTCGLLAVLAGTASLLAGVTAAALSFLILEGLRRLSRGRRGDPGLGFGDVKLVAALALWLGALTPWMVTAAALAGLSAMAVLRPADGRLAFGPAIAVAAISIGYGREAGLWPT